MAKLGLYNKLADEMKQTPLIDSKKTTIVCSACGKDLVVIWITRPTIQIHSKIVVECPFCEDKSFVHEFDGQFLLGYVDDVVIVDSVIKNFEENSNDVIQQEILIKTQKEE